MKPNFKILVVEDSESLRESLQQHLGVYNDVDTAADIKSAREALQKHAYEVVVLDKGLPDGNGLSLIPEIKTDFPGMVVLVLTADNDFGSVRRAMDSGADDYVVKSENIFADLLVRIPFAVERACGKRDLQALKDQLWNSFRYEIVGRSQSTELLRSSLIGHKSSNAHVLITGESGTGKELIARRLHALAAAGSRPFVEQNCAALPENLIESELFGHVKGAFTGAVSNKAGKFELAHRGDLFLDEVGELPLPAQAKLLRVMNDGQFFRVGGVSPLHSTCRVIAATNRDIDEMVRKGTFREDLYYRLAIVRIRTTPLRKRSEDIEDISKFLCLKMRGQTLTLSDKAIIRLQRHDWPGNIRELKNTIERAAIRAENRNSAVIEPEDISLDLVRGPGSELRKLENAFPSDPSDVTEAGYRECMHRFEREYFIAAIEAMGGNTVETGLRLGLGRSTVFKKLVQLGIPRRAYGVKSDVERQTNQSLSSSQFSGRDGITTALEGNSL